MHRRALRRRYGRAGGEHTWDDVPRRVQIVKSDGRYFKPGQYAYVIGSNTHGGMHLQDRPGTSAPGEVAYLVSKTKHMGGGALWFSAAGIRFTRKRKG